MNLIEKTLRSPHTKNIRLFIVLILFAGLAGERLTIVAGSFTIGSLIRTFLPVLPFLFLITVIFMTDLGNLNLSTFGLERPNIKLTHIFLILCIALPISLLVYFAGINITMTNNLIIVLIIAGFSISIFVSITYGIFYGIIGFILTFPFLAVIKQQLGGIFSKDSLNIGPIVLDLVIIFLLALFFASLLVRFTQEKGGFEVPLSRTIGIYLFVLFLSVATSENFEHSLKMYLLEVLYPVLFFFLVARYVKTDKEIRFIIFAVVISALLYSFFALYFFKGMTAFKLGISDIRSLHEFHAIRGHDLFLLLTLPLALSLGVVASKATRITLVMGCLIMSYFLLFSPSRIVVIAMFVSLGIFLRNKRVMIVAVSLSVLAFIFWDWTYQNVFTKFHEFKSIESLHPLRWSPMRYYGWKAAIDMIKDYPLTGIGWGMWGSYYYKYGPYFLYNLPGLGLTKVWISSAHNAFLHVAATTGIFGLIPWLLLFGTISKEGLNIFRNSVDRTRKTLALGCISSLVGFWMICLGGGLPNFSAYEQFGAGIAFWTMASIIFAIKRLEESKESKTS